MKKSILAVALMLFYYASTNAANYTQFIKLNYSIEVSFSDGDSNEFDKKKCLDPKNKVIVDLLKTSPQEVVIQEKDYLVSSERLTELKTKIIPEDTTQNSNLILKVDLNQIKTTDAYVKLVKVLINDSNLIKLFQPNTNENAAYLLVSPAFDFAYYKELTEKLSLPALFKSTF